MTRMDFINPLPCALHRLVSHTFLWIGLVLSLFALSSLTQASTAITETTGAGNLGTQVLPPSGNVYGITGGTTAGNNLYHSFAQFNVGTGDIAQFQTSTLVPNSSLNNILTRVTGGNPSSIFGTIDSATYYPGASFFLMNPNGVIFGPNATLNVGGSVTFTTADYLKLANTVRFEAIPGAQDVLLNAFPVAAFGFLGSNPAAISVQGSTLSVQTGQSLALVSGSHGFTYTNPDTDATASVPDNVTMTGGRLSAPSGQINIASVASAGEISAGDFMPTLGVTMGNIALSQGATLDVSGTGGGIIRIRGGQFTMDHAFLFSNSTVGSPGSTTAITATVSSDITLSNGSAISARALGQNQGGTIEIIGHNITVLDGSIIETGSRNAGQSGDISVTATGNLLISGSDAFDNLSQIQSNALAGGGGGSLTITAANVILANLGIIETRTLAQGPAGNITLMANRLDVTGGGGVDTYGSDLAPSGSIRLTVADTISLSGQFDEITVSRIENQNVVGDTGNIVIDTSNLNLSNNGRINSSTYTSSVPPTDPKISITARDSVTLSGESRIDVTGSLSDIGPVEIHTGALTLSDLSTITTGTDGTGASGPITLAVSSLTMTGGSQITSHSIEGFANGGSISIISTGNAILSGQGMDSFGEVKTSGIFSRTNGIFDDPSRTGNAGNITLTASSLTLSNGARIDSSSNGLALGNAGQITVTAPTVVMDGGIISTSTQFSGAAGAIAVNASNTTISNGGQITSSSVIRAPLFEGDVPSIPSGNAGTVKIQGLASPAQSVLINGPGSGIFTDTQGTGAGGNVLIETSQSTTLTNGAAVSAASTGTMDNAGDAGMVTIHAGNTFFMQNSSVTTQATKSGGGQIEINAANLFRLVNSKVSSSVLDGTGGGGDISIDPNLVVLQNNSQILAQAIQGAGGNITIFTPLFLADSSSLVSASSQFGLNGTVTIQSPTSNLSGSLGTLSSKPSQAQSLLTQRCAALANGQASSFVVAGREQLSADPGGWLSDPIALAGIDVERFGEGTVVEGTSHLEPRTSGLLASDRVSLRRLTPAGFLIANFADSEATGCHS